MPSKIVNPTQAVNQFKKSKHGMARDTSCGAGE
jgi:hypothetical protein